MSVFRATLLAPLYAFAGLCLWFCARYSLPDAEAYFFPVIGNVRNESIVRTTDKLCWVFSFDKLKFGATEFMAWTLEADGNKFFVTPINQNTGLPLDTTNMAVAGEHRVAPLCIALTDKTRDAKHIRVNGQFSYRVAHGLWLVDADIPVFPPD